MTRDGQCEAPACEADAEFESPGNWCERHWEMWWNWSAFEPEPEWMRKPESRQ